MPDEFTPEEKAMLAESPADSATMIGEDLSEDEGAAGAGGGEQAQPNADEKPPAGAQA